MAKKVPKKKQPAPPPAPPPDPLLPLDPRPKTCPYAETPITLCIGPERKQYYVPNSLLQNPDWVNFPHSWGGNIHLSDVDEGTGHVLVHYLYTGAYQTLNDMESSTLKKGIIEFRRALLAYIAAKKYSLHGLKNLARDEVKRFGAELDIFDIVEAINNDFSKMPDNVAWFHRYLDKKVQATFEEDHTIFANDDFFDCISNAALTKVLAKCVVQLYNKKVSYMLNADREPVMETAEDYTPDTQTTVNEEPRAEAWCADNEAPAEECIPEAAIEGEACYPDNEVINEEYPPAQEYPPPAEECPIDATPTQETLIEEPVAAEESSVLDFDTFGAVPTELTPVIEERPSEPDEWGLFEAAREKRKRMSKKETRAAPKIEESALPPPPPPFEPELEFQAEHVTEPESLMAEQTKHDIWGTWESSGTIKEDRTFAAVPGGSWCSTPVPLSSFGTTTNDTTFAAVPDPSVEKPSSVHPPPVAENKGNDPGSNLAATTKIKKLHKSKKFKKSKKHIVHDDPPPHPPDVPEAEPEPFPEPKFGPVFDDPGEPVAETFQPDEVDMLVKNGHGDLIGDPEQPVEADKEICPLRAKHLLEGDMWKSCEQCRALLRQIAIEIARKDLVNEDGYEVVGRV
ncbi:uncharacterized protein K460DRAFT_413983 [Cucurbitaria berberidis CBS 394.84]|uniref:BTB domain-containing protein n=1 Tax=Cucurbitaria berberidis CBS 394.84 TaxID=1168544 RepID=A0A9P4GKA0_9PLEO|nr:uncharacterized protein K460DRAFT_413983 [Cucurbitaria berberidis CBS 394.84]KAF1847187.1 hypothetical protein K460DRAFT_413983 [Cucurbitaria berberidis CBS 394.84]